MKYFIFSFLVLFGSISAFSAEESRYYCYLISSGGVDATNLKNNEKTHIYKKYFLDSIYHKPHRTITVTIDGENYRISSGYHLMTRDEYKRIQQGYVYNGNVDELKKWLEENVPANTKIWDEEDAKAQAKIVRIKKWIKWLPFPLNKWTMLIFYLPLIIPVILLTYITSKYKDDTIEGKKPSLRWPWITIAVLFVGTVIYYFYGGFLINAYFEVKEVEEATSIIAIIIFVIFFYIGTLSSTIAIKGYMLDSYGVKIKKRKWIYAYAVFILVAMGFAFIVLAIHWVAISLLKIPEEKLVWFDAPASFLSVPIMFYSPFWYIKRDILKQNPSAKGLLMPYIILTLFNICIIMSIIIIYIVWLFIEYQLNLKASSLSLSGDGEKTCKYCNSYHNGYCHHHQTYLGPNNDCAHFSRK